jgi:superfamily I DNA/RNA helicase
VHEGVAQFNVVIVDEAQDLTACQMDILKSFQAIRYFIGDVNQSIYRWRGASDAFARLKVRST